MSQQKKILLWGPPRCLTTAVFRAFGNHPDAKVVFEPFLDAFYYGEEKLTERFEGYPIKPNCKYSDIKQAVEGLFPNSKLVFVKDLTFFMEGRTNAEFLPRGYQHTFIMRDPRKSILALHKMVMKKPSKEFGSFKKEQVGYKQLYKMVETVTKELGQEAVIIDADDLLENPEAMMRLYCERTGIDFSDSLLNWNEEFDFNEYGGEYWKAWHDSVQSAKGFKRTVPKPVCIKELNALPQDVQDAIEDSLTYYEQLYPLRLLV